MLIDIYKRCPFIGGYLRLQASLSLARGRPLGWPNILLGRGCCMLVPLEFFNTVFSSPLERVGGQDLSECVPDRSDFLSDFTSFAELISFAWRLPPLSAS